ARMLVEDRLEGFRIDARQRDIGADAGDDQQTQGVPDPLLQLGRLGERAEIDAGRQLFRGRCHAWQAPLLRSAAYMVSPTRLIQAPPVTPVWDGRVRAAGPVLLTFGR